MPVTDILVHYCMGKIQEVILKKFLQLERKKRKIIVLIFVYICVYKYVKYIYTYAFIYIYICNVSIVRPVISILYLFKLSILKIYIETQILTQLEYYTWLFTLALKK